MSTKNVNKLVDHLFRHETGKMVAVLVKIFGLRNLTVAEDVVQETLLEALHCWSSGKIPDNPTGWLMQVAKRKTINILKREQYLETAIASQILSANNDASIENIVENVFFDSEIKDSQLRMIFTCCHPYLSTQSQIAFTLKTLCGFSTKEVADALLTSETTINKRLYRTKQRIRSGQIAFEIPTGKELEKRVNSVCLAIYLLFNEGYNSSHSSTVIRRDLCAEALRLGILLAEQVTHQPQVFALVALMLFHSARFDSRTDEQGGIIIFKEQNRALWNRELIQTGLHFLKIASTGDQLSAYHLEAGIAAEHCIAKSFDDTNWQNISRQYHLLYQIKPIPVIELNQAIILSKTHGVDTAIKKLRSIEETGKLKDYFLLPATLGEFYFQVGQLDLARDYFRKARGLTQSDSAISFLNEKIKDC